MRFQGDREDSTIANLGNPIRILRKVCYDLRCCTCVNEANRET